MAILISTPQELDNVRNDLTADYELANDIDLSNWGNWTPIGNSTTQFTGSFDGKGFKITNMTISINVNMSGLFGYANGFQFIRNLGMENCSVTGTGSAKQIGVMGGFVRNSVQDCYNLYVKDSICLADTRNGALFGKLYEVNLRDSYSLNCDVESRAYVGGLIGRVTWGSETSIRNCYSASKVTDTEYNITGGMIGGDDPASDTQYSGNYFDEQVATYPTDIIATPKTTTEMQTQSTYLEYDFDIVWGINDGYPYLQVFGTSTVPPKQDTRITTSYVNDIHSYVNVTLPPKTESRKVNSFTNTIESNTECHISRLVNVMTYLSPITSKARESHVSSIIETRNITGYVNPIFSNVSITTYKQPITVQINVNSHIKQIQANTDFLPPLDTLPLLAYISVSHNRSITTILTNPTNSTHIENPSYCEVIE